jgi:phage terminase large subunit-like protein
MRRKPKIDTAAANRAIRFFENLKLSTGQWAGQRVKLMPWQKEELVVPAFGTLLPDGRRQYRTVYLEIPRKNAKTESGAMFGCYLLFGDDEAGAQVYSAAGDQEQAGLIYNAAAPMIRQNKSLLRRAKILENRKRIVYRAANSFWQVLSAEAYSKHGLNAHGILFDELHVQPTRELWTF